MGAIAFTVQYDCIFIKRGDLDTETDGHTEKKKNTLCEYEGRAWMMCLQVEEFQRLTATTRS